VELLGATTEIPVKTITDGQKTNAIPFDAEIHNRHQLLEELDQLEDRR